MNNLVNINNQLFLHNVYQTKQNKLETLKKRNRKFHCCSYWIYKRQISNNSYLKGNYFHPFYIKDETSKSMKFINIAIHVQYKFHWKALNINFECKMFSAELKTEICIFFLRKLYKLYIFNLLENVYTLD